MFHVFCFFDAAKLRQYFPFTKKVNKKIIFFSKKHGHRQSVKVSKMSKMHEPPHAYILILFKFRLSRSALLAKNLHLFEVKEVRVIA